MLELEQLIPGAWLARFPNSIEIGVSILLILLIAWIAQLVKQRILRLFKAVALRRSGGNPEDERRVETLARVFRHLLSIVIYVVAGMLILAELGTMKAEGQIHMLDAQGIDPFLYLVVPRVLAFSICMFSLTTVFVAVALLAGFLSGALVGITQIGFFDFLNRALGSIGRATYVLFTLKTVVIGFVVALISCKMALSPSGVSARVLDIMPRGFAKSALATLIISIALTILF